MGAESDERAMVRTVARLARLIERGSSGLSLPQYRVLVMVAAGDARATRLANSLNLAKPTITAMVEALVERGLMRREVVEGDRRAVSLHITPDGQKALADAETSMAEKLGPMFRRLDERQQRTVLDAFAAIEASLDAAVSAAPPPARAAAG